MDDRSPLPDDPGVTAYDGDLSGGFAGGDQDDPSSAASRVVIAIALGAAAAAAVSGAEPTGAVPLDVAWLGLAAILVTWAASRSQGLALTWLAAVAAVVGVAGGFLPGAFGLAALGTGVIASTDQRRAPEMSALSGALALEALLRGPSYGPVLTPTLVALAAVAPVVVVGWRAAPRSERKLARVGVALVLGFVVLATAGAGAAALLARTSVESASNDAESALALLRDGDLDAAAPHLAEASTGFERASSLLGGPLAWAGRGVPVVGQHVEALARVSAAGESLTTTTEEAVRSADYEALKADNGRVDLDEVRAMVEPVRASADAAISAQRVVEDVRSPWLIGPVETRLDRLAAQLADTVPAAINAADALEVAPALLGEGGPKRYLLQFATPGESRAAGGFVGSYALLTADDGNLDLALSGSVAEISGRRSTTGQDPPYAVDLPPGWEELYSSYNVERFPGNVSASPDWPTDSDIARQIYTQVPDVGTADGVLYADPVALAALLELTGPVDVEGVGYPLDSGTVEQYLFVDQYVQYQSDLDQRRDVLAEVTSAVFDALTDRSLPSLGEMRDVLGPVVASGHLRFVSFDERAAPLLERTGISGDWKVTPGADWLSVRSANMLPNKIDWYLRRDIHVDNTVDATTGTITSRVTVTLQNQAPESGLPSYLVGNWDGLPDGTNRDALSLYTPHALQSVTVDGSSSGVESAVGFGGNVYTVPVTIPPGGTATVVFELEGQLPAGPRYALDVLAQPLAHPDQLTIELRGAAGGEPLLLWDDPLSENLQLAAIGS